MARDRSASVPLRELADCAMFAVRLAWQADRRSLLQVLVAQLATALGLMAVLLLIRHAVGGAVTQGGPTTQAPQGEWLIAVIAGLVLLGTGAGILRAVAGARQRVLAVKVDRFALDIVLDAAGRAELPEFEDPAFHDRLQRAVFASRAQPAMVVTALAAGFQAVLTVVAVTAVFAVLVWWLLPFALLAVLPTLKAARDERGPATTCTTRCPRTAGPGSTSNGCSPAATRRRRSAPWGSPERCAGAGRAATVRRSPRSRPCTRSTSDARSWHAWQAT